MTALLSARVRSLTEDEILARARCTSGRQNSGGWVVETTRLFLHYQDRYTQDIYSAHHTKEAADRACAKLVRKHPEWVSNTADHQGIFN